MVNADNGLREIRMRRYGCLFLGGEEDPLDCTQNEELNPETRQPAPGITDSVAENLRVNELTPWLNTRARTIVNPTVMYDSTKEEMYVNLYLRIYDETAGRFNDLKYEFVGDLKAFKDEYRRTRQRKYLNLRKQRSESNEIVNAIVHCYDIPTCKDITLVVSFANVNSQGESFVDSRPFMIDQRETDITPENTVPNQTQVSITEPIILDIDDEEYEDEIHQGDYTPDEGDSPPNQSVGAPLLRSDDIDFLCEGLIEEGLPCPRYLVDPTLERPTAATSTDTIPETTTIQPTPQSPEETTDDTDTEQEDAVQADGDESPAVQPTPDSRQQINLRNTQEPIARPKPRPPGLSVQIVPEETVELVDVINEEVFPDEEVILVPHVPRQPEPNIDVLPQPDSKNYDTSQYHQFIMRLRQIREQALIDSRQAEEAEEGGATINGRPVPVPTPSPARPETIEQPAAEVEEIVLEEDEEESPLAVRTSIRPRQRPDNLVTDRAAGTDEQAPTESAATIPFTSIDGRFTYDLSVCGEHIVKAKNLNYRQARGHYSSGSLRDSTHYTSSVYDTVFHKPRNASKQHGSEITKQVTEFVGCVLKQRYGDDLENQVNNLSLQRGGQLGRQRSHQNGLDIDVSYPHINNATSGFDNFAGNLNSARVVAAFDQARLLIYTDRVQVLFTDDRIRRRFCTYLRDNNKLSSHRSIVERFMRHWDGHHNHYHVRVKCTLQNEGCVPDNDYANTNYCGN